MFRLFALLACAVLLGFGLTGIPLAESASFTFTKIADTDTPIPGGAGNFAFFGGPAFDGAAVAFSGGGACFCASQLGVYADAGGSLQKLADSNTPIPGSAGNFSFFGEVAMSGGTVAFRGDGGSSSGVYASAGGSLTRVGDTTTAIPGGVGSFQSFGIPLGVDSGRVVFVGTGSSAQRGVYSFTTGSLTMVVDTNTAIPGGTSNFGGFFSPSARAGNVAFAGFDPAFAQGVYTIIAGVLAKAADTNTSIPGGSGNFASFGNPSFDGSNVAFSGSDAVGMGGLYVVDSAGVLKVVADATTPAPGGTGNFTFFGDPSTDNGNVAFVGLDGASQGALYRASASGLTRIIGAGDLLDGKVIAGIGITRHGLIGNTLAVAVGFADGSQGIFIAREAVPADVFLHRSGSSLVLDGVGPTATTPASQDSATLKFVGVNPWKTVGSWSATPAFAAGTLDSLSPFHAWLGLRTTDDNGTRFDLRAEVLKNGALIAAGEASCITGVMRDPARALEISVPFGSFSPIPFNGTTDVLSLRVLARIGTNGSGGFCGGHNSATGLRLYFDAISRPARFDVQIVE